MREQGLPGRPRRRSQACPATLTRCDGSIPILDSARSYF
jgi:hypothetical protein